MIAYPDGEGSHPQHGNHTSLIPIARVVWSIEKNPNTRTHKPSKAENKCDDNQFSIDFYIDEENNALQKPRRGRLVRGMGRKD